MKAFDAILDGRAHDTGLDFVTGLSLSREMSIGCNGFRPQLADRQRLTVASNYFALACPIMPIGLLGIFMLLAGLDTGHGQPPHLTKADEVARENMDASQQMYLLAMKEKREREARQQGTLACSRQVELITPRATEKPRKRRDIAMQPEGKVSDRVNGASLLSKQKNDASKLIKQKMALESHLDKMSQEQDYAMHTRLSAQLDLLDKALKKLGA